MFLPIYFLWAPIFVYSSLLCATPIHHLRATPIHVACPSDCRAHPTRIEWSQLPRSGGRLGWSNIRQTCQHDGLLGYVKVGSRHASCLDTAVVLGDVHAAAALSLASLDQGRVGHLIRDEV